MTDQTTDQDVAVDLEAEVMEEGATHDPKNAEAQSIVAVDAATQAVKTQAPGRTGDKRNAEPMPKTKAGMLSAMVTKMQGMNKGDLGTMFKGMHEDVEFEGEEADVVVESILDVDAELSALVESEATLSEEFKEKTAVLFEAALKSKLSEEIDRIEAASIQALEEEVAQVEEGMVNKIDSYLNYVVESWMTDNEVAIQAGLRTEIAESFMAGLKTLFTESYIEVPEAKVDLVDGLAEQVEELEAALNKATLDSMKLVEKNEVLVRSQIIAEAAFDLADTQAEKLATLVESVDFESVEVFTRKVAIVKESHFATPSAEADDIVEATEGDEEAVTEVNPMMQQYLTALNNQ